MFADLFQRHSEKIRSVELRPDDFNPRFDVYRFDATAALTDALKSAVIPTATLNFANTVNLIGSEIRTPQVKPGQQVEVITYWRITTLTDQEAVLFTHVLSGDPDQPVLAQQDSLDVPSYYWLPGDAFAQVHRFIDSGRCPARHVSARSGPLYVRRSETLAAAGCIRQSDWRSRHHRLDHRRAMTHRQSSNPKSTISNPLWLMVGILLLAAAFRFLAIDAAPPGWRDDELIEFNMDRRIADGWRPLFITEAEGHEPVYHYLHAGTILLFGDNIIGYKWLPMAFGLLTDRVDVCVGEEDVWRASGAAGGGLDGSVVLADHVFALWRAAYRRAAVDVGRVLSAVSLIPSL